MKPGPKRNTPPHAWALRFGIHLEMPRKISAKVCWQLCQCRTDEARRLILGVSK